MHAEVERGKKDRAYMTRDLYLRILRRITEGGERKIAKILDGVRKIQKEGGGGGSAYMVRFSVGRSRQGIFHRTKLGPRTINRGYRTTPGTARVFTRVRLVAHITAEPLRTAPEDG